MIPEGITRSRTSRFNPEALARHRVMLSRRVIAYYGLMCASRIPPRCLWFRGGGCCTKGKRLKLLIERVPIYSAGLCSRCCLPYPGDPKSAIDCFFLFGISLHPGVTGSAPHWKFRGCRVHSFPSPQELLRPASWLALLSRTFTFELAPTRSPSISVEYDYVDKQSIPTAGLSPASPTALWAAGHRISPDTGFPPTPDFPQHRISPPANCGWPPTPITDSIDSSSISCPHNNLGHRFLEV